MIHRLGSRIRVIVWCSGRDLPRKSKCLLENCRRGCGLLFRVGAVLCSSRERSTDGHCVELYCPKVEDLHLTALEITHSLTAEEIDLLVIALMPQVERMVNLPRAKGGARLGRPMISFDAQALALSFLPLAGGEGDEYGYHHLRRDLWDLAREKVKVASRYVVPSAHITLGRFLGREVDAKEVVRVVEDINGWLESDFGGEHGEWIVGREVGLCFRKGRVWYGGGESVCIGEGI